MSMTKAVTVRLDPEDYERLAIEASRLGMAARALARAYVRAGLARNGETEAERKRRVGLEALERLAALREELRKASCPPVDAVRIAREACEELEERTRRWVP